MEAPVLDAYVTLDPSHLLQVPKDARHTTVDNIYTLLNFLPYYILSAPQARLDYISSKVELEAAIRYQIESLESYHVLSLAYFKHTLSE